jgi:hypothetical protein
MRGRNNNNSNNNNNNNNRRGPNPLTRSYESNGPDVKIRGSAQQIAEKYGTLARDAQSSGDRVMAENYLQHAEHYNRIIAAAQAQMAIQQVRDNRDDMDEDGDDERVEGPTGSGGREQRQSYANDGSGPQPVIEGTPAEVAYKQNGAREGGQNEAAQQQPTSNSGEGGHEAGERANGGHAEAATGEENAAPRRARRPRRRANGHGEDEGRANGGGSTADEPSGEAGAMEPAEQP